MVQPLTRRQIAALLNVNPRTVDKLRTRPEFPQPLRLGPQTLRWRAEDIDAWIGGQTNAAPPTRRGGGRRSSATELMA